MSSIDENYKENPDLSIYVKKEEIKEGVN